MLWGREMLQGPAAFAAPEAPTTPSPQAEAALAFRAALGDVLLSAVRASAEPGSQQAADLGEGAPELDVLRRGTRAILTFFDDRGAVLPANGRRGVAGCCGYKLSQDLRRVHTVAAGSGGAQLCARAWHCAHD